MSGYVKKIYIGSITFIALVVAVIAGLWGYLHTDHAHRVIEESLSKRIPGSVSFESLRVALLRGSLDVKHVRLKDSAGVTLAGFDHLHVAIEWMPLLRGNLTVTSLLLEKPWSNLRSDEEGTLNLAAAVVFEEQDIKVQPEERAPFILPLNIIIEECRIHRGAVHFEKSNSHLTGALQGIDLTLRADTLQQSGNIQITVPAGHISTPRIRTDIHGIELNARMQNGHVKPFTINLVTTPVRIVLSGTADDIFTEPHVNITADILASLSELGKALNTASALTGDTTIRLTARGPLNNPDASLHLTYTGGVLFGNRIDRVDAACSLADRHLAIDPSRVQRRNGSVTVKGSADLKDAFPEGFLSATTHLESLSYELSLEGRNIQPEALRSDLKGLQGEIDSIASLRGRGISLDTLAAKLMLRAEAKGFTVNRIARAIDCSLKGSATLTGGTAQITQCTLTAGATNLEAEGSFNTTTHAIDARVNLTAPDLAGSLSPFGIANVIGTADLAATIDGPVTQPRFDFKLRGNNIRVRNVSIGGVRLAAHLDKSGRLTVPECIITNGGSMFRAEGSAAVYNPATGRAPADPEFSVHIDGRSIDLEDFTTEMKGLLSLTADLSGTLQAPSGSIRVSGSSFIIAGQKIDKIEAFTSMDGHRILCDPVRVFVTPDEFLEGTGWVSLDHTYSFSLTSGGISLHNIEATRTQGAVDGVAVFDIKGEGRIDTPRGTGVFRLKDIRILEKKFDDFTATVNLADHVVHATCRHDFDLDASYNLKDRYFAATAVFDSTDLSSYFTVAGKSALGGTLSGTIEARGHADRIKGLHAEVNLEHVDLYYKNEKIMDSNNMRLVVGDGGLTTSGCTIDFPGSGQVTLTGTGMLDGSLSFGAEGTIPLHIISLFSDDISDITGSALFRARVNGTIEKPLVNADIVLRDIGIAVPALSTSKFSGISGSIRMTTHMLTLENIRGKLGDGSFELGGTIGLVGMQPARVMITAGAAALPVGVEDTLDMLLNANLRIEGIPDKSSIVGEITILEGTYYKDINLSLLTGIGEKKRGIAPAAQELTHPLLKNMALDISIKGRNPFIVDNNLAALAINPDFRIVGTLNNPIIRGRGSVESGTITYQRKTFTIKKGIVDFVNPYKIEPSLDIVSEVTVRQWLITLAVSGTPEHMAFKLTSNPSEEHEDILSLLLLGRTTGELIAGEGGTAKSTEQILAEMVAATFGDDIKKATDLDIFEVETVTDDSEDTNRIKVTIGKELSRRMTVKYSVETEEGAVVQRATAEYKLLENILISAFEDTEGVFGGELQFRLEFR